MRCLKPDDPEDIDRVAQIIHGHDLHWNSMPDAAKQYARVSARAVLTEFDVIVPPEEGL